MHFRSLSAILWFALATTTSIHAQLSQVTAMPGLANNALLPGRTTYKFTARITVRINDFDQTESKVIASAKKVTSEIFRQAGLQISWVECMSQDLCAADAGSPEFRVRIVPQTIGKAMVSDDALGFAVACAPREEACLCYIFHWRIRALAEKNQISADRLLGHVIAHEIGHTLLGPNAHNLYGVMQHILPTRETERMLYFTSGESKQLRADLEARKEAARR